MIRRVLSALLCDSRLLYVVWQLQCRYRVSRIFSLSISLYIHLLDNCLGKMARWSSSRWASLDSVDSSHIEHPLCPIEDIVILYGVPSCQVAEHASQSAIIWFSGARKRPYGSHIVLELVRKPSAQCPLVQCLLHLHHQPILFVVASCFDPLPRKTASTEVYHHVTE